MGCADGLKQTMTQAYIYFLFALKFHARNFSKTGYLPIKNGLWFRFIFKYKRIMNKAYVRLFDPYTLMPV